MVEQAIASVVESVAKASVSLASWWMFYQPKLPKALKKKEAKDK